jgi:hypothetical protein
MLVCDCCEHTNPSLILSLDDKICEKKHKGILKSVIADEKKKNDE